MSSPSSARLSRGDVKLLTARATHGVDAAVERLIQDLILENSHVTLDDVVKACPPFFTDHYFLEAQNFLVRACEDEDVPPFGKAFYLLRQGLKQYGAELDKRPDLANIVAGLCPFIASWTWSAFQCTDDVVVRVYGEVVLSLLRSKQKVLREAIHSASSDLFGLMIDIWMHIAGELTAHDRKAKTDRYNSMELLETCLGLYLLNTPQYRPFLRQVDDRAELFADTLVKEFIHVVGHPAGRRSSAPLDIRSASLCCLATPIDKCCLPAVRSFLISNGFLPVACRLLHKLARDEIDLHQPSVWSSTQLPWRTYQIIIMCALVHVHGFINTAADAVVAVSYRALSTLLRLKQVLDRLGASSEAQWKRVAKEAEKDLVKAFERIAPFAILPSCRPIMSKAMRHIERLVANGEIKTEGRAWDMVRMLQTFLYTARMQGPMVTGALCCNPLCSLKSRSPTSQPREPSPPRRRECSGCSVSQYCSSQCQAVHWSEGRHREHCPRIKQSRIDMSPSLPSMPSDSAFLFAMVDIHLEALHNTTEPIVNEFLAQDPWEKVRADGRVASDISRKRDGDEDFCLLVHLVVGRHRSHIQVGAAHLLYIRQSFTMLDGDMPDPTHWNGMLGLRRSNGPYVAIAIGDVLVALTNRHCLKQGIYPMEVFA